MSKKFFNYGVRIAIIYWIVSFIWIFFSDQILENMIEDFNQITHLQTIKGVGFITLSALLIYFLIQYYNKQQKSIENKIIENEERQRLLIDNSMDAIMVTSPDGSIIDVNPSAERFFGKTAQEIIQGGRNGIMDLTDPRLPEALKIRQETGSFVGELNFVYNDGTIFPGDVSSQLFTDSEGNVRTSMIIRDISERKKLEKELADINLQLKKTLESISDALITVDREWIITSINPRAAAINKKPIEEFLGNNLWEEWPILSGTSFEEKARKSIQDAIPTRLEFHYFIEGQYDVWLDINIYPSEDGLTLIYRDINNRKMAELEKELYSHIFEESLNEIFIFDTRSYRFLQANKAAITNLGYTLEELKEMTPIDIKPLISKDKFEQMLTPLLDGRQKQVLFETIHQRKDGSTYEVEVHVELQNMGYDSLFTAIVIDITERKRGEKIIIDERQRLESIIKGTNVGTWGWNVQTDETIFNDRWAEIVGYTLQELEPISINTWKELTHPEDFKIAEKKLQAHFSGKEDYYDVELRMKHKKGHWVWIQDRGRVSEWTKDGLPLIMQGTHQDITQRKQDENRMLEQLEELRRWHDITLGREERIIELKQEINQILVESGKPPRYESVTGKDDQ